MQILTLNLWKNEGDFPDRLDLVRDRLLALRPDVVCFQEVYQDANINALTRVITPDLVHIAQVAAREKCRDGRVSSSGLGVISRFPIISETVAHLPSSDNDGGRVVLRIDLDTPLGPIRVVCLHLSHLRKEEGKNLRKLQWQFALDFAYADWTAPIVFCGDFNDLFGSDWLQDGLAGCPYQTSAAMLAGQTSLRGHPNALIDHIVLINADSLSLTNCALDFDGTPEPSDHLGVYGELVLINETANRSQLLTS